LNEYGGDTSSGRDGYDNWSSYLNERNKIFNFINDNNINGVQLILEAEGMLEKDTA